MRYFFAVSYAGVHGVHDFDIALAMMSSIEPHLGERCREDPLGEIGHAFTISPRSEPTSTE